MTDTESLGIPFHLRERSMEVALLSCWLYCVDVGFVCLWLCWPVLLAGSSCRFLLCLLCLPVLLAGQSGCFFPLDLFSSCLPVRLAGRLFCVVLCVSSSSSSSPAGGFGPSSALDASQYVVISWV